MDHTFSGCVFLKFGIRLLDVLGQGQLPGLLTTCVRELQVSLETEGATRTIDNTITLLYYPAAGLGRELRKLSTEILYNFALLYTVLRATPILRATSRKFPPVSCRRSTTHWILGENPKAEKARWSVLHDVLGFDISMHNSFLMRFI